MHISKPIRNLLVLTTLIGMVLLGWLVGHVLRYSIPAFQLQHPPIQEFDPHIKNGLEFEGIRRQAVLMGIPAMGAITSEGPVILGELIFEGCVGNTYYTSLPAKCRTAGGQLVQVGGGQQGVILLPGSGP